MPVLDDVRVLEVGDFISVAQCGKLLADFGADVIKVELPEGDSTRRYGPFPGAHVSRETSGLHLFLDANKRSITLDYRTERGRALLLDLVGQVDVFITNLDLAERERLGLTYEDVRAHGGERLIYTAVTPFGDSGPRAHWKGYGINVWSGCGQAIKFGEPDREPLNKPLSEVDSLIGLNAAGATMMAILARDLQGAPGQQVDISGLDCIAQLMNGLTLNAMIFEGRPFPLRNGYRSVVLTPWGVYPCKDGYVEIFCPWARHWEPFTRLMGDPRLIDPAFSDRQYRNDHVDEVEAVMVPWLAARTKAELAELFDRERLPFAVINTIADVVESVQLREREFFMPVEHPVAGTWRYSGAPFKTSFAGWQIRTPAPLLGQHTGEVLQGLGLDVGAIVELERSGAA